VTARLPKRRRSVYRIHERRCRKPTAAHREFHRSALKRGAGTRAIFW